MAVKCARVKAPPPKKKNERAGDVDLMLHLLNTDPILHSSPGSRGLHKTNGLIKE